MEPLSAAGPSHLRGDFTFLVAADKVRKNTAFDVCDDRLVSFIDGMRAKTGNETRQDGPCARVDRLLFGCRHHFGLAVIRRCSPSNDS